MKNVSRNEIEDLIMKTCKEKTLFKVFLKDFQYYPISNIQKENLSILDNEFTKNRAKIYFFVKEQTYITRVEIKSSKVTGLLKNGNRCISFSFFLYNLWAELLFEMHKKNKEIKKLEKDPKIIFEYFLNRKNITEKLYSKKISLKDKLLSLFGIENEKTSFFSYKNILTKERNEASYHLYQLINSGLIKNIPEDFLMPKILYIGKSNNAKGILAGRVANHEKSLDILKDRDNKVDEILAFMFEIVLDSPISIDEEIVISCIEEILIRYFLPTKNYEYRTTKTGKTSHISKLIDMGLTDYLIELNFKEHCVCRFGTDAKPYSQVHNISGKLSDLK